MSFSANLKSVDETAIERNWPPKRVRKLILEGLPFVMIGRQKLINSDSLDRFLKNREKSVSPCNPHANNANRRQHAAGRSA